MNSTDVELGSADRIGGTFQRLLDKKGQNLGNQHPPSIYKVPSVFRDLSKTSFDPRVVAIGPLHREDENLQAFESHKETYIHHLLDRVGSPREQTLQACLQEVNAKIDRVKACYEDTKTYKDDELAKMMVIDGCFILEFVHHLSIKNDPVWKNMLITQSIIYDLLLIENQIPFFVLEDIYNCTISKSDKPTSLSKLMEALLRLYNIFEAKLVIGDVSADTTVDHILGLLHKSLLPTHDISSRFKSSPKAHSAMELDRAGVKFTPYKGRSWQMAMKLDLPKFSCFPWFCCKPTLRMPVLCINDFTDLVLRNLIIYEQLCLVPNYVTAYASAMDMLIDTPEDVARLVKSRVVVNSLGSNEKAADMINNMCEKLPVQHVYYDEEWKQLDTYYNGCWPKFAAGLKRKYFSSPWNIIALSAAIILFALTLVQTIFAIKAA